MYFESLEKSEDKDYDYFESSENAEDKEKNCLNAKKMQKKKTEFFNPLR